MKYHGRNVTATELAQVRAILARATGIARWRCDSCPTTTEWHPAPGTPLHRSDVTTKIKMAGPKNVRICRIVSLTRTSYGLPYSTM